MSRDNHPAESVRVNIVGVSAAGKSTLAIKLARELGIPNEDLDELHWRPEWQSAPLDEFRGDVDRFTRADNWVLAGNYRPVRDLIWPRSTHVIWLNYSFSVVWWRVLSRTARRVVTRERVCNGNTEKLWRALFHPDSILLWVLRTYQPRKREFRLLFADPDRPPFTVLEITDHRLTAAQIAEKIKCS